MAQQEGLKHLFVDLLKDMYNAESQIMNALPKMEQAAKSQELKRAFKDHLDMTKSQRQRIEQVAKSLNVDPGGKQCKGMEGLIREGEEVMNMNVDQDALDAGLIQSAQKVEHYEIAGYGTLKAYAKRLGFDEAAQVFDRIAAEEGQTDHKLTQLAETSINRQAMK